MSATGRRRQGPCAQGILVAQAERHSVTVYHIGTYDAQREDPGPGTAPSRVPSVASGKKMRLCCCNFGEECRGQVRLVRGDRETATFAISPGDCHRFNSPSRARTYDLAVNSRPLYQLSYRGIHPKARLAKHMLRAFDSMYRHI